MKTWKYNDTSWYIEMSNIDSLIIDSYTNLKPKIIQEKVQVTLC